MGHECSALASFGLDVNQLTKLAKGDQQGSRASGRSLEPLYAVQVGRAEQMRPLDFIVPASGGQCRAPWNLAGGDPGLPIDRLLKRPFTPDSR